MLIMGKLMILILISIWQKEELFVFQLLKVHQEICLSIQVILLFCLFSHRYLDVLVMKIPEDLIFCILMNFKHTLLPAFPICLPKAVLIGLVQFWLHRQERKWLWVAAETAKTLQSWYPLTLATLYCSPVSIKMTPNIIPNNLVRASKLKKWLVTAERFLIL